MESLFAGLLGFLVGRGVPKEDAQAIIDALEKHLGFEPPVGLEGYVLQDITAGEKKKSAVVVRGKTYDAKALENIQKHQQVAVLGKTEGFLDVAPVLTLWKHNIEKVDVLELLEVVSKVVSIENIKNIESIDLIDLITKVSEITTIKNIESIHLLKQTEIENIKGLIINAGFEMGDLTHWETPGDYPAVIESDTTKVHFGSYCAKLANQITSQLHYIFNVGLDVKRTKTLGIYARSAWASVLNTHIFTMHADYLDGTKTDVEQSLNTPNWTFFDIQSNLTAGKKVKRFRIVNQTAEYLWVDDFDVDYVNEYVLIGSKGLGGELYERHGDLLAKAEDTLCSIIGQGVTLETFEFSSNNQTNIYLLIYAIKQGETSADLIQILDRQGTQTQPIRPDILHTHFSDVFEELIYDDTNNYYKFGLKRKLYFPNGVIIKVWNNHESNTYKCACQAQVSIEGE